MKMNSAKERRESALSWKKHREKNIMFCVLLGKTGKGTVETMKKAYKDDTMCERGIYKWYAMFKDGKDNRIIQMMIRVLVGKTPSSQGLL